MISMQNSLLLQSGKASTVGQGAAPDSSHGSILTEFNPENIIVADGQPVDAWPDSHIAANDLTGTTTARPIFRATGGPNGTKAVEFDGVNDLLTRATWAVAPTSLDIVTFLVVSRHKNLQSNFEMILVFDSLVTEYRRDNVGDGRLQVVLDGTNTTVDLSVPGTAWRIQGWALDVGVGQNGRLVRNGVLSDPVAMADTDLAYGDLSLGARNNNTLPLDGYIAHVRIYDAKLSAADLLAESNELNDYYGVW